MLPCSCSVTRRSWDCRGRRRWQVSTYVYHRYMASPMPAIPLRLDSVVKRFGDLTAVSGVSLEVRERACLGLLGLVWLRRGRSGHHLRTCTLQAELPLESTAAAPLCRPSRGRWRLVSAVRLPARPPAYRQAADHWPPPAPPACGRLPSAPRPRAIAAPARLHRRWSENGGRGRGAALPRESTPPARAAHSPGMA